MKFSSLLFLIVVISACKHPLSIEGEGDIIERLFGERGCTLEEFQSNTPRCSENEVTDEDYKVSYEAIPRQGWRFLRWAGLPCAPMSEYPFCEYGVGREWINLMDQERPDFHFRATTAVFVEHPISQLSVSAQANGGFGPLLGGQTISPDSKNMVVAAVLLSGETIVISAEGEINIATDSPEGIFTTPDGSNFSGDIRPSPYYYFPLEDAAVDSGELEVPVSTEIELFNIGGLIGAFVPQSRVRSNNFIALNDNPDPDIATFGSLIPRPIISGSIPSDALFLVGSGPFTFEAQEDGTLFLGVNDASVSNNSGAFTVSITVN